MSIPCILNFTSERMRDSVHFTARSKQKASSEAGRDPVKLSFTLGRRSMLAARMDFFRDNSPKRGVPEIS